MRGVIATLGAVVLVGTFAVSTDVGAQERKPGSTTRGEQDTRACAELPALRHELARLQHELRRLRAALSAAKQAGNRERAQQIMMEMRQVQSQIEDVQHKIRRLLHVCGR